MFHGILVSLTERWIMKMRINDEFASMETDIEEILALDSKAKNTVLLFSASAAGTGAIPIPFADMPLLIGEQVVMMSSICAVYGIKVKKDGLKMLAVQAIGAGGASLIGKTVATNVIKFIPGGGTVVGGAVSATTAGTITFALGMTFIRICDDIKLGKLSEKDMFSKETAKKMKKMFKDEFNKKKDEGDGFE